MTNIKNDVMQKKVGLKKNYDEAINYLKRLLPSGSYKEISRKLGISKNTIKKLFCNCEERDIKWSDIIKILKKCDVKYTNETKELFRLIGFPDFNLLVFRKTPDEKIYERTRASFEQIKNEEYFLPQIKTQKTDAKYKKKNGNKEVKHCDSFSKYRVTRRIEKPETTTLAELIGLAEALKDKEIFLPQIKTQKNDVKSKKNNDKKLVKHCDSFSINGVTKEIAKPESTMLSELIGLAQALKDKRRISMDIATNK
jgi:hypothetical protein